MRLCVCLYRILSSCRFCCVVSFPFLPPTIILLARTFLENAHCQPTQTTNAKHSSDMCRYQPLTESEWNMVCQCNWRGLKDQRYPGMTFWFLFVPCDLLCVYVCACVCVSVLVCLFKACILTHLLLFWRACRCFNGGLLKLLGHMFSTFLHCLKLKLNQFAIRGRSRAQLSHVTCWQSTQSAQLSKFSSTQSARKDSTSANPETTAQKLAGHAFVSWRSHEVICFCHSKTNSYYYINLYYSIAFANVTSSSSHDRSTPPCWFCLAHFLSGPIYISFLWQVGHQIWSSPKYTAGTFS